MGIRKIPFVNSTPRYFEVVVPVRKVDASANPRGKIEDKASSTNEHPLSVQRFSR